MAAPIELPAPNPVLDVPRRRGRGRPRLNPRSTVAQSEQRLRQPPPTINVNIPRREGLRPRTRAQRLQQLPVQENLLDGILSE